MNRFRDYVPFCNAADCTLPTDIELWRVKAAVEAAREFS